MPTPATVDPSKLIWRRSSRSSSAGANCVEAAHLPHLVAVRDSKDREGPMLAFPQAAWVAFVAGIKHQQFDGD